MILRIKLACVLFLLPTFTFADPSAKPHAEVQPESLLAPNTLVYLRFDGFEPHRQAAEQTAFAEIMRGDLGHFVDHVCGLLKDSALPGLMEQLPVEYQQKLSKFAPKLWDHFNNHGVVTGLEVLGTKPLPRGQLTIVFPGAGSEKYRATFLEFFETLAKWADCTVSIGHEQGRTVYQTTVAMLLRLAWWREGEHLVFTVGTESVSHTLARLAEPAEGESGTLNLTQNSLFQSVNAFHQYETVSRGFVDCRRILDLAVEWMESDTQEAIDELGLSDLQSLTWQFGYEGKASRSTVSIRNTGERKGLLALTSGLASAKSTKLPPLPPDTTDVAITKVNWQQLRSVVGKLAEAFAPDEWQDCQEELAGLAKSLGMDPVEELIDCLGPTVVTYNSPSEGWQFLGLGLAVEVKDPEKLQRTISKLIETIAKDSDTDIRLKKRQYHGVGLYTLNVVSEDSGLAVAPSYTIHNGWLVAGLFPQRVQGYILRAQEGCNEWHPSAQFIDALENAASNPKAKVVSASESNPEPTLKFLLSLAPFLGGYLNMIAPDSFDPVMIPNAHEVARRLFPNVTLVYDDGDANRWESYTSLALPFDVGSLTAWYGVGCMVGMLNGEFDIGDYLPSFGQTPLPPQPDPITQATYQAPPPDAPPGQAPQPDKKRPIADLQPMPGSPSPITPAPVQQPQGALSLPNLLKLAGNPAIPGFAPPPPPNAANVPPLPNGPGHGPQPPPLPTAPGVINPMVPAMPAMPPMPTMPNGVPALPGGINMRDALNGITGLRPVNLTVKAYPVTDLIGKDGQAAPEAVLVRLVKMVEPNSWEDHGGWGGIDYFPLSSSLIIRQSPEVHEKIEKFLKELQETVAKQKK